MPWRNKSIMDQREEFVLRALNEAVSFSQLCEDYGISRKTGYKWKERFLNQGKPGLIDQSRKPDTSPKELSEDIVIKIIQIRHNHPSWGAKKIAKIIENTSGPGEAASISSVYRILDKANLLRRKRTYKSEPLNKENLHQLIEPQEPNDVWTIDYKGWWLSADIKRCNPLTIRDLKSRYNLDIRLTQKEDTESVKAVMETVFKEYGLPKVIRSDNGAPFAASNSPLGLSQLAVSWMALGILPDRIDPGKPYQNGSHERMHRDLKADVQKTRKGDISYYQSLLDEWRHDYNFVRAHEALGMVTPSKVYTLSPRKFEGYIEEIAYPNGYERRKVDNKGCIKWSNQIIRISTAFQGYHVGLTYEAENLLRVWFSNFLIGEIDLVSASFYTLPII
jgi:transposase InsO family protein